jgi:hypothetical protein
MSGCRVQLNYFFSLVGGGGTMTTVSDQNSANSGSVPMTELFLHS